MSNELTDAIVGMREDEALALSRSCSTAAPTRRRWDCGKGESLAWTQCEVARGRTGSTGNTGSSVKTNSKAVDRA